MKPSATLHGAKELQQALDSLSRATQKSVVRRALVKSLKPMAAVAKAHCPRRTGTLAKSISASTRLHKREGEDRLPTAYVGPAPYAYYAHMVEFGTVKSAPHPFMRSAFESTKEEVIKSVGALMWREIEAAAKRKAKRVSQDE